MKVLGVDFETQSIDAKETMITQVGAALYSYGVPVEFEWSLMNGLNRYCYEPEYPPQSKIVEELTGITDDILKSSGIPRYEAFSHLVPLIEKADIIIAHNESFDRTVLESTANKLGIKLPQKEWLCTLRNFPWPKKYTCHKLGHLAWEHGLNIKAKDLHSAFADVECMFDLVKLYDFEEVLKYAREPWVYLKASCCGPWVDQGVQTGIAKSFGFSYEKVYGDNLVNIPKTWVAKVKTRNLESVLEGIRLSASPFKVERIEGL